MNKRILTNHQCQIAAGGMVVHWKSHSNNAPRVFGVPRGGVPVSYLLCAQGCHIAQNPDNADWIVDDVIDSGGTKIRWRAQTGLPFSALSEYIHPPKQPGEWLVFPWEVGENGNDQSANDCILRLLQYIGEDVKRGGLKETPQRVLKAWKEWTSGYEQNPAAILKVFDDGGEKYDQMIVEKDLPFYSHCEHHLAPFFGTATIAYIPDGQIVGLSKLGRILEVFARRLQVQERLTTQIADAIAQHLKPKGVGVIVKARHLCMESRGYNRQGHVTVTSALRGIFTDNKVRAEFLSFANK